MKIENQVCRLEQAKRLKELGVNAESSFAWICIMPDPTGEKYSIEPIYSRENIDTLTEFIAQAYTVAELGVMLLYGIKYVNNANNTGIWRISFEHTTISPKERNYGTGTTLYMIVCTTQAAAYASLLIYMLENNLIMAAEVNQRLQSA